MLFQKRFAAAVTFACAAALAVPATAKDLERAAPESVGVSSEGLAKLKAAMTEMVTGGRRAGLTYAVARHGKLVALEAIGKRDLAQNLPMEPDTAFRIYSMSRAPTAVTTLSLVDEGKLKLDDPVMKYIPEIGKSQVIKRVEGDKVVETEPQRRPMTVYDVFTYTAGYGYAFDWPKGVGMTQSGILDITKPISESMKVLATYPLLTQPGAKWHYGFSGDVLGRIAEVASGKPLGPLMDERLFKPLDMSRTGFWISPAQLERRDLATVYTLKDGKLVDMTDDLGKLSTWTKPGPFYSGGGGLVSTAPDYLRFVQMLLQGGKLDGVQVLRPETVKGMLTRQTTADQGDVYWYNEAAFPTVKGFGWGLSIGVRPDTPTDAIQGKPGERYWGGAVNTVFFLNLDLGIAAVAMSQYQGPNASEINFIFRDGVYAAMLPDQVAKK